MARAVKTSKPAQQKPVRNAKNKPPSAVENDAPLKPDQFDIAERAYYLYLKRGGHPGGDFDDWLQAERELREASGQR